MISIMPPAGRCASPRTRYALAGISAALLWLTLYWAARLPALQVDRISLWYLPAGVTVAVVLALGPRSVAFPLAANLLVAVYHGTWLEYGHAIRHIAIYGGAGWLLYWRGGLRGPLASIKDVSRFIGGVVPAGVLAAFGGVSLIALAGLGQIPALLSIVPAWSIGDSVGVLILAPLLIPALRVLAGMDVDGWTWVPAGSLVIHGLVIGLTVALGFGLPLVASIAPQLWYVVILPPIAIALWGGFAGAATAVLVTNLLIPPALQVLGSPASAFEVQVLLLITSAAGLLMGAAISERERALEAVRASEQALEQKVVERTVELRHTMDTKMHLLASISHDLRQPVQALSMYLEALERNVTNADAARLVVSSSQVAQRLSGLLSKLLDLARLDAKIIEPQRRAIPIQETLDRLAASFLPLAKGKGLRFRVSDTALWTSSDPVLLERILGNLVENAINSTSRGGLLIGCRRRGDAILVQVVDTGTGIAPEDKSLVFDQFRRGRETKGNGLGLGLYIVSMTATLLGHPIEVQSVVGRGTCFSVTVPKAQPEELPSEQQTDGRAPASAEGALVLLVEDDPAVRDSFVEILSSAGYMVLTAGSHGEALSLIASLEFPPDVLVLDYRLPQGKRGTETLRLARDVTGMVIPGVIVTGETASESIADLRAAGVPVLHKPVSGKELLQAVSDAVADSAHHENVT